MKKLFLELKKYYPNPKIIALRTFLILAIALVTITFTACSEGNKKSANPTTKETDSEEKDNKGEASGDEIKDILEANRPEKNEDEGYTDVMVNEDSSIDDAKDEDDSSNADVEEEGQHPFTFEELYHNVYVGTIGNDKVIMDIYPNLDEKTASISFIGTAYTEDKVYQAYFPSNYTIVYKDTKFTLYLSEFEDGVLTGTYDSKDGNPLEVSLKLSHINYVAEANQYYTVGTNQKIEAYAKKIRKVIENNDIKGLAKMIEYPISVNIGEGETANNESELISMGATAVITSELREAVLNSFPKFMFCNAEGVMIGSGEYNIWFTVLEDGEIKIIALNN